MSQVCNHYDVKTKQCLKCQIHWMNPLKAVKLVCVEMIHLWEMSTYWASWVSCSIIHKRKTFQWEEINKTCWDKQKYLYTLSFTVETKDATTWNNKYIKNTYVIAIHV